MCIYVGFEKKGFPRFVFQSNQPIHSRIGAGAEAAQSHPKETKEKQQEKRMLTTADRWKRRSFTTTAPTEDLPPSSKAPKHRYQSAPPRRTATRTTLLPRVSPGTRRGERKGRPRRPPGRSGGTHQRRRVGVGQADRGFPRSQSSPRVLQSLPPNRPPSCATMVKKPPRRLTTAPRGEACTTRNRSRD